MDRKEAHDEVGVGERFNLVCWGTGDISVGREAELDVA
jgi:hypothetical protein